MKVAVQSIGALIIGDEILSGKRADKHLEHVIATLSARGLALAWARYEGDDRARLVALLRETFAAGDIVNGGTTVVQAVAEGARAAREIHQYLRDSNREGV